MTGRNMQHETAKQPGMSRRGFLAAAGTTAGASALGVTSAAFATGAPIALDRSIRHQTWRGFGAAFAGSMQQVANSAAFTDSRHHIIDALFDKNIGIGLDIARLHIGAFSESQEPWFPNRLFSHWQDEEGPLEWTKDQGQVWATQRAYEANPDLQVMASPWSPPYWMKTNNSVFGIVDGEVGTLKEDYYRTFARYLSEYVKNYRTQHGITIDHLSYANEPGAVSAGVNAEFPPEAVVKLVKTVGAHFRSEGLHTTLLGPEEGGRQRFVPSIEALYADPEAWQYIDIVASHAYGTPPDAVGDRPFETYGKEFWMTERTERGGGLEPDALDLGELIHGFLTTHNLTAYLYWLCVVYPERNDLTGPVALLGANLDGEFAPNQKYYVMGQYSKFIDPGYVRIAADGGSDTLKVSAFTNPAGRRAVTVFVNRGGAAETRTMTGLQGRFLHQHRTSATENLKRLENLPISDGQATVTIPANSVVTLVELGGRPQ